MRKLFHSIFSVASKCFFEFSTRNHVTLKSGAVFKRLLCKKQSGLTSVFGCEGDLHAPIAFIDGSFLLRDRSRAGTLIHFGFTRNGYESKIKWYNAEGWYPCLVSEFRYKGTDVKIENFADKVVHDGKDFEIAYSRVTYTNRTDKRKIIPKVSKKLIPLTETGRFLGAGETAVHEYATGADRFSGEYAYPSDEEIRSFGTFSQHYESMKHYWDERIKPLAEITVLPDKELIDAYKAGYVYTMIVKDGDKLCVGENGYDRVFDHDIIGISAYLLTIGDFKYFKEYTSHILDNVQYPDARWKYSWPYALWLMKTGDTDIIKERFSEIKGNTHAISRDRTSDGIMKMTSAIDSPGYWTVDNWSALMGLTAYGYICEKLGEEEEKKWAENEYDSLFEATEKYISDVMSRSGTSNIPISLTHRNEDGPRSDPRDANALSMFSFGRWGWDGYLFGAKQRGVMIDAIDETYEAFSEKRKNISDSDVNFGGYPHGYYSSAYNAGYGSTALRGKKHREYGIEAYNYMINHTQSGPFSWWEGIGYPDEKSPWDRNHAAKGGGSCPHIWGQSTATKVLFDSLICEKSDGTVIIGRGIPERWKRKGNVVEVRKYPLSDGRVDVRIEFTDGEPILKISPDINSDRICADF